MTGTERDLKVKTCMSCTFSECTGKSVNKCNSDTLYCTAAKKDVVTMVNESINCPQGYWNFIVAEGGGCGCGG